MIESLSNIASIHQYSKVLHGENNSYSLIITASIKVSCCIYADKPAMIKSFLCVECHIYRQGERLSDFNKSQIVMAIRLGQIIFEMAHSVALST